MELRARLVVEGFVTGMHRSPYKGFSVEFAEHRQYMPGDPLKHIDWKVYGKTDRFYIKEYEEETNLRCTILLDCSRSMRYGDARDGLTKFDYARTTAAFRLSMTRVRGTPPKWHKAFSMQRMKCSVD